MSDLILSKLGHTWILDIDGMIVKHNGYKIDGVDTLLPGVNEFFESLSEGDMVILVTSRTKEYQNITEAFLVKHEIRYDHIIYGAPYGERIIINDNKPSGLEMSKAVCLGRDGGINISVIIDENL